MATIRVYTYNTLGENVKKLRESKNLTQMQLAVMAGISQSYLSYVELGLRQITVQILCNLCNVLECRPDDLLEQKEVSI